jgi:hypothetical protein
LLLLAMLACTPDPAPPIALRGAPSDIPSQAPASEAPAPDGEVAWERLAHTQGTLGGDASAAAVQNAKDLAKAWEAYGFPGEAPDVGFNRFFVLLLAQADDACIDELVGLEVTEGRLRPTWLPPPGGCEQPLIMRIHAIKVHRAFLPSPFEVVPEDHYEDMTRPVTITFDGVREQPPAPPEQPRAMSDQELDAVFEGHAVRRCTAKDELTGDAPVDGPLSDDPKVAKWQRGRAGYGVASDEQSTRAAAEVSTVTEAYGFPLAPEDLRADREAMNLLQRVMRWWRDTDWTGVEPMIDRRSGIHPMLLLTHSGDAGMLRRDVDTEFGSGNVLVESSPYEFREIEQAQEHLNKIMGGDGPGAIVSSTGVPGPVALGMIDPTREALDKVAATVDPALVCVGAMRSGVQDTPLITG